MVGDTLGQVQRRRMMELIARAAPPHERMDRRLFEPVNQNRLVVRERSERWFAAVADGDHSRFMAYLEAFGWNYREIPAAVADVRLQDDLRLPHWASGLLAFLEHMAMVDANGLQGVSSLYIPFASYMAAGRREVDILLGEAGVTASDVAKDGMSRQLAVRLANATTRALDFELQVIAMLEGVVGKGSATGTVPFDVSCDGWISRLECLPGLGYVIGVTWTQWRSALLELLRRVSHDCDLLAKEFWHGSRPSAMTEFGGDAGDVHSGGRAVVILTFDDEKSVVYKPKDLRVAAKFMDVVAEVGAGLPVRLPLRRILPRRGYAWEERVVPAPCRTIGEVDRFYFRFGATIRLIELVGGRDFWLDNLLAVGEHPVFVDLETLLQPPRSPNANLSVAERAAWERLEASVARTGAIVAPTLLGPGVHAEDLGALTPPRDFRTPFRPSLNGFISWGGRGDVDADGYVVFHPPPYVPYFHDQPAKAIDHLEPLFDGYLAVEKWLHFHGPGLFSNGVALARSGNFPVRYIVRDTWSCHQLIQASVGPVALQNGVEREIELGRMFRSQPLDAELGTAQIIKCEIDAFRDLNVPFFYALPSCSSLFTEGGTELINYFDATALDRLAARLQSSQERSGERLEMVKSCIGSGLNRHGRGRMGARAVNPSGAIEPERVLGLAVNIGEWVLDAAEALDNDLAWVGLRYDPYHGLDLLDVLGRDALTGTCGLAVLFTDLFSTSGKERFRDAAVTILRSVAGPSCIESWRPSAGRPWRCGGFIGAGCAVYALRRCGEVLDEPQLEEASRSIVAALPLDKIAENAPCDIVSGIAGLSLVLAGDQTTPAAPYIEEVSRLREPLLDMARRRRPPPLLYPRRMRRLDGLPGAAAAIRLALVRTAEAAEVASAPALRPSHATGDLLAALDEREPTSDQLILEHVARRLKADPKRLSSSRLLDNVELAVGAYRATDEPWFELRGRALAGHLAARQRSTASWFPERVSSDRHELSMLWGVPAIAHALLRLYDKGVASFRLLSYPASVREFSGTGIT